MIGDWFRLVKGDNHTVGPEFIRKGIPFKNVIMKNTSTPNKIEEGVIIVEITGKLKRVKIVVKI